jgi:YD repeat-containing protein
MPEENNRFRVSFRALTPGFSEEAGFEAPPTVYTFSFFEDFVLPPSAKISYITDARGRVLTETRKDEEDNTLAEIKYTWGGDRLDVVEFSAAVTEAEETEVRRIEFEYNAEGNRIAERNYRNGVLERTVRSRGSQDIEELYLDGVVILRAVWEDGRKISEERVRPPRRNSR